MINYVKFNIKQPDNQNNEIKHKVDAKTKFRLKGGVSKSAH